MTEMTRLETPAERNTRLAATGEYAWTGSRMIHIANPDPEDMVLDEIAVGLSREPRYGAGATALVWSVAQHSLLVDHLAQEDGVTSPELRLMFLLHDAPEYMLRDLISPVKAHCPDYKSLENVWWAALARKFSLPPKLPGIVKHYDRLACASEKAILISPQSGDWPGLPSPRNVPQHLLSLTGMQAARHYKTEVLSQTAQIAPRL